MFNKIFDQIFFQLNEIEGQLEASDGEEGEREDLKNRLIQLRRIMDGFVNYWLRFEEKVNLLEEKYHLQLPEELFDDLPLDLWDKIEGAQTGGTFPPFKGVMAGPQGNEGPGVVTDNNKAEHPFFFILEDQDSVRSFRKGLGYYDLSMVDEAIQEFKKVVEKEPDFILGHFFLGVVYSKKAKYERALKEFRLVKALSRDQSLNALIHNFKGNIYAEQGKNQKALEEFLEALSLDNNFHDVFFNLGATCYNMGKYKDSVDYFKKSLEHFQDDWEIYFYLGKALGNLGDYQAAITNLEKAVQLNQGSVALHLELGVLYELTGEKTKARTHYSKIKGH